MWLWLVLAGVRRAGVFLGVPGWAGRRASFLQSVLTVLTWVLGTP